MPLTEATRRAIREIIARYPRPRSALLPMLHLVQAEEGYVSAEGVALCAEELGLTKAEVGAVATFYTMYKRRPAGEYLVSVCTNLSCQILGAEEVYAGLSKSLGVGHDETTADGRITLEHAECLAACDYAPVMTVNYEFFDNVTPESAGDIVAALQRGERPVPTRGEPLVDFRGISRQLAGFADERGLRQAATSTRAAHPTPPEPVDSRASVDLAGSDVALPTSAGDYGVPGGITESALTDAAAAATYGGGPADAGESAVTGVPSPSRDQERS
ncbi:MAG: NADH-quinone oxidoreductase subunit NuoE [Mycobacteriales bacterium]